MLAQEKEIAIENEEYDLAKNCKEQIDGITRLAYQIGEPEPPVVQPHYQANYSDFNDHGYSNRMDHIDDAGGDIGNISQIGGDQMQMTAPDQDTINIDEQSHYAPTPDVGQY